MPLTEAQKADLAKVKDLQHAQRVNAVDEIIAQQPQTALTDAQIREARHQQLVKNVEQKNAADLQRSASDELQKPRTGLVGMVSVRIISHPPPSQS